MDTITITGGGPEIADGVYPVTLIKVEGPKTVTAQRGPNAGKDIDLLDWTFAVDEGQFSGVEIQASTSTASGPKSKMYAFLTALFGGKAPPVGTQIKQEHIVGRTALATIRTDDQGWARIDNLGAMPADMLAKKVAQATGSPTSEPVAAATPLREQVAAAPVPAAVAAAAAPVATADDLPF